MHARLRARLLGRPSFDYEGREVVLRSRKTSAMLAYLCLTPDGADRDTLAETFWEIGKLANVRQALYELRQLPGANEWLSAAGSLVSVAADTDVAAFDDAMSRNDAAAALTVYGGDLLAGDLDVDAPPFQEWLSTNRHRLADLHVRALVREAERLEAHGELEPAALLAGQALELDRLDESLCRLVMRLAYVSGDVAGALRRYDRLVTTLDEELGATPEEETRALAEAMARREPIGRPARLDLLPAERLRLLQVVALCEGALGVRGMATVLAVPDDEVAEGLASLQRSGWLDAHLSVPAGHLAAVMDSLAPSFRRLLHERIAEVLGDAPHVDDAVVARHLLAAGDPRSAAPRFVAAAQAAIDGAALDHATSFLFLAGWAAFDLPSLRQEAHALLEGVASQRGDAALQEAALASAELLAAELQDDDRLVDVRLRRSRQRLTQGRVGEGLELALEALEIANRLRSGLLLAKARNAVGAAHYFAGDLDGAAEVFASNLQAEDLIERYRAYSNLASLAGMRGASEEAYGRFEEALTLARAIGPRADVAATLNNLAATADRMGEYAKAVRHFREGIAVSRRNQAVDREGRMLTNLAAVYARQGQLGPSWNTAAEVEELAETISAPRLKLAAIELKADVQRLCGLLSPARADLETALAIAEQLEDERKLLTLTAQLRAVEAQESGAFTAAEHAIEALDAQRLTDNAPWLWFDLALSARDAQQALGYVQRVTVEGRLAHHRVVADIATLRAARLTGADAACLRLAADAAERLPGTLDTHEIVERPLGRLLLATMNGLPTSAAARRAAPAHADADEAPTYPVPDAVMAEVTEQGAGLPQALRDSLRLQPDTWLTDLRR